MRRDEVNWRDLMKLSDEIKNVWIFFGVVATKSTQFSKLVE
jgi:hypothetical protein